MATFVDGAVIKEIDAGGKRWRIEVVEVYNPSAAEIASNKAFNDTLGNWEPDRMRPLEPQVRIEISAGDSERFEMYWIPTRRLLGPHISRPGWSGGTFNAVKIELSRWHLPCQVK